MIINLVSSGSDSESSEKEGAENKNESPMEHHEAETEDLKGHMEQATF